jgi:hypothetical protein
MPQCQFPIFYYFCVSEKLHRKYSQNWTNQSPNILFFPDARQSPKESRRGARGPPHHLVVRVTPRARQPMVCGPWLPSDIASPPIKSLHRENPKLFGVFPVKFRSAAAVEDQFWGTEVSVPAPCRDGEVPPEPSPLTPWPPPPSPSTSPPSPSMLLSPMMRRE